MKKPIYKRWWFIVLVVIIIIAAIGSMGGNDDTADKTADKNEEVATDNKKETNTATENAEVATKKEEAKEEDVPREYKAALNKAKTYVETMHLSKAGLYDQLTSEYGENFPKDAAQYAIEKLK